MGADRRTPHNQDRLTLYSTVPLYCTCGTARMKPSYRTKVLYKCYTCTQVNAGLHQAASNTTAALTLAASQGITSHRNTKYHNQLENQLENLHVSVSVFVSVRSWRIDRQLYNRWPARESASMSSAIDLPVAYVAISSLPPCSLLAPHYIFIYDFVRC